MMVNKRGILVCLLNIVFISTISLAGCGYGNIAANGASARPASSTPASGAASPAKTKGTLPPVEISFFISDPGQPPTDDNRIYKLIRDKLGVTCRFEFLVGDKNQKIGVMAAGEDYPDVVFADSGTVSKFTGAGALIPLEDLIRNNAPNLEKHYAPYINQVKDPSDGHFYVMANFGRYYGQYKPNMWEGPAFWIQKAVLAEAGYPKPRTLDEYFSLIEQYKAKHPTIDGQPTTGFEILCDGWRDFCLKNPPEHLIGHPNDGGVVVDGSNKATFFWNKDYSKAYYKKLNEENAKGIIDPETFTLTYDQYVAKLSSGSVLGMFDQHWDFSSAELILKQHEKLERTWVPVPCVLDAGIQEHYQDRPVLNINTGFSITRNCKDPVRVLKFFDALLTEEWMKILMWGIKGEDYEVDGSGMFYMNQQQRENQNNQAWRLANQAYTLWYYGPKMEGTFSDGNACTPGNQPQEFYDSLKQYDKDFLDKYGFKTWTDFLSPAPPNRISYPAWQIDLVDGSPAAIANTRIGEVGTSYLPKCILAEPDKFESTWNEYVTELHKCDINAYITRINDQLKWRAQHWTTPTN